MTTGQAIARRNRRPRGQHPRHRRNGQETPAKQLPEYLEAHQVEALTRAAPNSRARLLFLIEWRAGFRISEALALEARDLSLESELPSIHVREGKGSKPGSCRYTPSCRPPSSVRSCLATSARKAGSSGPPGRRPTGG